MELEDPTDGSYRDMPFTSGLGWTWSGEAFDAAKAERFRCGVMWLLLCFTVLGCVGAVLCYAMLCVVHFIPPHLTPSHHTPQPTTTPASGSRPRTGKS